MASSACAIACRSSSPMSPNCSSPSTNRRSPRSVGSRPALVWGANSRPASVRSDITLRIVAGDNVIGSRRDRVRLPTGSPVWTYCSTISRSTAAERGSSSIGLFGTQDALHDDLHLERLVQPGEAMRLAHASCRRPARAAAEAPGAAPSRSASRPGPPPSSHPAARVRRSTSRAAGSRRCRAGSSCWCRPGRSRPRPRAAGPGPRPHRTALRPAARSRSPSYSTREGPSRMGPSRRRVRNRKWETTSRVNPPSAGLASQSAAPSCQGRGHLANPTSIWNPPGAATAPSSIHSRRRSPRAKTRTES